MRQGGDVDDVGVAQFVFQLADAAFDEALLFAGGVVFGVFFEVAVCTRLGNGFDNARAFFAFQFFQFGAQSLLAFFGHGDFCNHGISLCLLAFYIRKSLAAARLLCGAYFTGCRAVLPGF